MILRRLPDGLLGVGWRFFVLFYSKLHSRTAHLHTIRSVLVVLGIAWDSQNSGLTKPTHPETGEMGKSEHAKSSHAHRGDTSKYEKEVVTDKSKEESDAN